MSNLKKIYELTDRLTKRDLELKEQKERLELVIESCDLGIWDWNPQTNEVSFNDQWAWMLGYELSEIEPCLNSWDSRVHPDDIAGCFKDIQDHVDGKTPRYSNTHRMKHKNGTWVRILDRGRIVKRDNEGKPVRFTGTHTLLETDVEG